MKKCSKCGIIVYDDFEECPNCKSRFFFRVDSENLGDEDAKENIVKQDTVANASEERKTSDIQGEPAFYKVMEVVGGAAALLGIFFPFVRVSFLGTVIEKPFNELAPDDHVIFIVVAIIGLVGAIAGVHKLTAIIGMIYGGLLYADTADYFAQISSSEYGSLATKGFGFYCMVAGAILMIVFGAIADHEKRKHKQ